MKQKVTLQINLLLAISLFLLQSCFTIQTNLNDKGQQIIDVEIESHANYLNKQDLVNQNKVLFEELSNEIVINYLKKINRKLSNELSSNEIQKIFGSSNFEELIKKLENSNTTNTKYTLPDNFILDDSELSEIGRTDIKKFYLSNPIFVNNNDYALIAFSVKDGLSGINIYSLINQEWVLYKRVDYQIA